MKRTPINQEKTIDGGGVKNDGFSTSSSLAYTAIARTHAHFEIHSDVRSSAHRHTGKKDDMVVLRSLLIDRAALQISFIPQIQSNSSLN